MNWNNLFQLEKVIWNRNKFEVNFLNTRMIWYSKYSVSEVKQWFTAQNIKKKMVDRSQNSLSVNSVNNILKDLLQTYFYFK